MSVKTGGDGKGDAALVLEQRIRDLCHDELPEHGTGTEVAYGLIANELLLDGSARLNHATFVTTWMPPQTAALMAQTADKNMIEKDEYPQTAEIERAVCEHHRPLVARARNRRRDGHLDHRLCPAQADRLAPGPQGTLPQRSEDEVSTFKH